MADLERQLNSIESKLDKLDEKLDNHLERISKVETSVKWLRGSIKLGVGVLLSVLSGIATAILHLYGRP